MELKQTVSLNDNLIEIDNLITSLNYLYEDVKTRGEILMSDNINSEKVVEALKNLVTNNYAFRHRFIRFIRDEYPYSTFIKDVAFSVMEEIDADIEKFVNSRVEQKLRDLGVIN